MVWINELTYAPQTGKDEALIGLLWVMEQLYILRYDVAIVWKHLGFHQFITLILSTIEVIGDWNW